MTKRIIEISLTQFQKITESKNLDIRALSEALDNTQEVCTEAFLNDYKQLSNDDLKNLRDQLNSERLSQRIVPVTRLSVSKLAIASIGTAGAISGTMLWPLLLPELRIVSLGLTTFMSLSLSMALAQNTRLHKLLCAALTVQSISELLLHVQSQSLASLWTNIKQSNTLRNVIKRGALWLLAAFLTHLLKAERNLDKDQVERQLELTLWLWLKRGQSIAQLLTSNHNTKTKQTPLTCKLINYLCRLDKDSFQRLEDLTRELKVDLRFENPTSIELTTGELFKWKPEYEKHFQATDLEPAEGDLVECLRRPVKIKVNNTWTISKGLVSILENERAPL